LDDGSVREVNGGFDVDLMVGWSSATLHHFHAFVPYSRALPLSPDGHYHVCLSWDMAVMRCYAASSPRADRVDMRRRMAGAATAMLVLVAVLMGALAVVTLWKLVLMLLWH
jgi:hypothetical protein